MPNDGYVQLIGDGTGKKIDASELVRVAPDSTGTPVTVERQRVVLGADDDPTRLVGVRGDTMMVSVANFEEMTMLLRKMVLLLQILTNHEISDNDVKGI